MSTLSTPSPTSVDLDALCAREFGRVVGVDTPYLNNAATGPLPDRAVRAQHELNELRAAPWKIAFDWQFEILSRSRALAAELIGAQTDQIALMTNTSYGVNLAARALPLAEGDVVVVPDRDFPANVYPWMALERSKGVVLHRVPCAGRLFDEEALLAALDAPRVKVLSVSWVSFESGARLDIARLGNACRERGIFFVVDAIQGLGALTLDVTKTPVDILACGAQKWLLSPWGSGFAYVRPELIEALEPQHVGWMAVENSDDFSYLLDYRLAYRNNARRFEVNTLPFQDFAGFNGAIEVFAEGGFGAIAARVQEHADRIVAWAESTAGITLVTPAERERRAGIVAVIPRDALAASRALDAAGVAHSFREGAIRLSPHFFTPDAHVDHALEVLEAAGA